MLEAWKNEDIPHDENDSLYRLMVLLTLYARFYQDAGNGSGFDGHFEKLDARCQHSRFQHKPSMRLVMK